MANPNQKPIQNSRLTALSTPQMANPNPKPIKNVQNVQNSRLIALSTPRMAATPNRRVAGHLTPSSGRRNKAATPHARAAMRTLDQRRAALFTPGRTRRQSLREQRETPRDILRNLSRVLAPNSQIVPSSSPESTENGDSKFPPVTEEDEDDFDDDDFPIERPRFSLPLGPEDDDDEADLKPPRLSGLEEENYTMQSIELPRRVATDHALRSSLGSMRYSDYIGPDIQSDDAGIDSGFFPPPALDDSGEVVMEEPAVIERLDADGRRQTLGADSVFGAIEIPEAGNETTFIMAPVESPIRDTTMTQGLEDLDDVDDFPHGMDDDDDDHVNEPMGMPDSDIDEVDDAADENNASRIEESTISHVDNLASKQKSSSSTLASGRFGSKKKLGKKMSRHGIEYPSLPPSVVKRLATACAKTAGASKGKISPDTLDAIMQATDWFFEQLGDDLSAYAKHAGRKTIDESDMMALMRRQRQTSASTTPFALAQRHLPRELLQSLRMPVPIPSKAPRKRARHADAEGEEEEQVT